MKYFAVVYRYKTKPRFRKGRFVTEQKVFGAYDLMEALIAAKKEGELRWNRRKWSIVACAEHILTQGHP